MALHQEIRRRSSAADRTTDESLTFATTTTFVPPDRSPPLATTSESTHTYRNHIQDTITTSQRAQKLKRLSGGYCDTRIMPPPLLPADHGAAPRPSSSSSRVRHAHSSSTSRIPNRLSFSLPIAPPTKDPSRPTPSASSSTSAPAPSSVPATPQDKSAASPLSNVNDFIIAIAAKERKVMELKEEVAREETELASLKKQFAATDVLLNRGAVNQLDLSGSRTAASAAAEPDAPLLRRSVEFDAKTLSRPNTNHGTPTPNRRRVMRGGHTRTLSLLSPAKSNLDLSLLGETTAGNDSEPSSLTDRRPNQASNPALLKRATWQPRSQHSSPVVPQLVEDFKIGLRAFVEDIRQITIGDEPISGQYRPLQRSSHAGHYRTGSLGQGVNTDQSRIKSVQQRASETTPPTAPPTPLSQRKDANAIEKPKPAKSKPISWPPLGLDSIDDTDWANWDSPVPVKSTRWSGSTINSGSGVMDDIQCIPENATEPTASAAIPIKSNPTTAETPILSPAKLEELLPSVVNRLSPSNIKRTANNLLDEWEKSLVAPCQAALTNKENTAA
ncbi:hypothetical protein E4U22_007824 [Claviceps purpurea]|uniref:DUF4048 domain-containing protein n=1 Tax=Claviceps purpurea (strain 20.1) TaxID=1111077 RepID=M1WAJ0_CLAP2|nr:hypothetical protein E4U10_000437 [Claviceps purpurea]KAG6315442.1 hypothetical protein E4U22_007824 [Claviceps purpurea]CCE27754.1 uncharacterized protein CPUR_01228 [Claviceps purpurea 20.1]